MATQELDTGRTHRLGTRAFFVFLGWGLPIILLLAAGLIAWWWYGARFIPNQYVLYYEYSVKLLAVLIAAYALYKVSISYLKYRSHGYRFDDEFFHVFKGYITQHEVGVVYHQIQTVSVHRPLAARVAGVAHLSIVTSGGGEGSHAHLPAIDMKKARLIQRELLARAKKSQQGEPKYQPVAFEEEGDEDDE